MVTGGVANAWLPPAEGTVPLATAGAIAPRPVASSTKVAPGVVFTTTVLAADGGSLPCAENKPKSDAATPIRKGALFNVPTVTIISREGTPAGISNGTCTLSCVGLMKRMG